MQTTTTTAILLAFLAAFALGATGMAPSAAAQSDAVPMTETGSTAITVVNASGARTVLTEGAVAQLPSVQVAVSFQTEHGPFHDFFAGPLLWTVLAKFGAVDPAKPRQSVGQAVLVVGRDGYGAALAMGEIAPAFEGKQVILADSMDGHPLGGGHLRLIMPGDRHGGRSVRDVIRITVTTLR